MVPNERLRQEVNRLAVISGFLALIFAVGCRSRPAKPPKYFDYYRQRAAIEERTALVFTNAILFKPRANIPTTDLAFTLAPLLIREVAVSAKETNCGLDKVFYRLGAAEIAGITRPQMTYLWSCGREKESALGVRITLDSHGLPVLWEVLDRQSDLQVVFVSESLEAKAKALFGAPASGRRFAIEQAMGVTPDVVVARVIEDGPTAMGPIVHLTAEPCDISTVICRCMPTQARQLVATKYYQLKPLTDAIKESLQPPEKNPPLDERLRLPPGF